MAAHAGPAALPCAPARRCLRHRGRPRLATPAHETGLRDLALRRPPGRVRAAASAGRARRGVLRVGSGHDPPGKEGLAHLVEHLAFRARPGGGRDALGPARGRRGRVRGPHGADATDFQAVGDPEQLDALLAVEADRLRDPLAGVGEADLRREREVLVQELALRADPSSAAAQVQWLTARALPGHPYGRAESPARSAPSRSRTSAPSCARTTPRQRGAGGGGAGAAGRGAAPRGRRARRARGGAPPRRATPPVPPPDLSASVPREP